MTDYPSAMNQDASLYCAYFGGPRDWFKTGDLPAVMSGNKLTGSLSKVPLSQPHQFSLYAVCKCTSETQIDGFWEFQFVGLEGPNGEQLVAKVDNSSSIRERLTDSDEAALLGSATKNRDE